MAFSAIRKAPLAVVLMLSCAPAHAGWFSSDSKPAQKTEKQAAAAEQPATNLEDSIRQAQMLRLAAQYPEAIKHLSQLMMLASDDGRVVSEYGKTLASMGRASDAVNFLTRAQQLQPGEWSNYSAIGVAYDQIGDQKNAQAAYEQALKLKPEEPSVLSNYALSRMLAKDPEMARKLAARAESANSIADAKIARNIAMIREMAPQAPVDVPVAAAGNTAPHVQTATAAAGKPAATDSKVVMQRVPVDPLAGPVQKPAAPVSTATTKTVTPAPANPAPVKAADAKPSAPVNTAPVATGAPRSLQPAPVAQAPLPSVPVATATPPAPVAAKPVETVKAAPAPVTPAAKPVETAQTASKTAPAPVKAAEVKAEPVKAAEVFKPAPGTAPVPVKAAAPAPAKTAESGKPSPSVSLTLAPAKPAEAGKTAAAPKVLPPVPGKPSDVKAADAKPKTKEAIPGLRMSANAY